MRVHLVNPSDVSFGVGVITPRWLYVLAAATPPAYGDAIITDETLETLDPSRIQPGDVVGIGIHTANAFRGMEVGRLARERGAWVIYGGIHATLFPEEAHEFGAAHAVVQGDGDVIWKQVLSDCAAGHPQRIYDGGKIGGCPRAGTCCRRKATCGLRCRRCGVVPSTARSARSGARTASGRVNDPTNWWSGRSFSCAAWASVSSRLPTTISIP